MRLAAQFPNRRAGFCSPDRRGSRSSLSAKKEIGRYLVAKTCSDLQIDLRVLQGGDACPYLATQRRSRPARRSRDGPVDRLAACGLRRHRRFVRPWKKQSMPLAPISPSGCPAAKRSPHYLPSGGGNRANRASAIPNWHGGLIFTNASSAEYWTPGTPPSPKILDERDRKLEEARKRRRVRG